MSDTRFKKGDKVRLKQVPGRPSPIGFSFFKDYEVQDTTKGSVKLKNDGGDMRWLFDDRLEPAQPEVRGVSADTVWVDEAAEVPFEAFLERFQVGDWARRIMPGDVGNQVTKGRSYLVRETRRTAFPAGSSISEIKIQDDLGYIKWFDACHFELDMRSGDEESRLTPKPSPETKIKGWGAWA